MDCLFGIYNSIMENVYARNIESSGMSGTQTVPVCKRGTITEFVSKQLIYLSKIHYQFIINTFGIAK